MKYYPPQRGFDRREFIKNDSQPNSGVIARRAQPDVAIPWSDAAITNAVPGDSHGRCRSLGMTDLEVPAA